jgi:dihydroxyacetone kinase
MVGVKKLINAAGDVVGEALDGLTLTNAGIARLAGSTTALRSDVEAVRAAGHVALLSGGGAGHEPAHAGYVGAGMLTGAVAGEVFTSPSVDAVLDAIRAVASPGGVLLIVKNYTGDRLNFGLAAELARAEGIDVAMVVVADDVALTAESGAGRRGIAGWPNTVTATEPAIIAAPPAEASESGTLPADDPVRRALEAVAEAMISVRDELTELDRVVGDGDLGISLARGSATVLAECPTYPGEAGPAAVLRATSATLRRSIGGTSGPLYAIMLLRAAAALPSSTPQNWAAALRAGLDGVREVGGAEVGDRTMVDALSPAADAFEAAVGRGVPWRDALSAAADAAATGAAATANVRARLGRSSYLGDRVLGHPDPGAQAVALWLAAIAGPVRP